MYECTCISRYKMESGGDWGEVQEASDVWFVDVLVKDSIMKQMYGRLI